MLTRYAMPLVTLRRRTLLACDDPDGTRFSSFMVDEAINEALVDIAVRCKLIVEQMTVRMLDSLSIVDMQQQADVQGKREYAMLGRITYEATSSPASRPFQMERFDLWGNISTSASYPSSHTQDMLSYRHVRLFPQPIEDGEALPSKIGNVIVQYYAIPDRMTVDTDVPDTLMPNFHMALVAGAAARLMDNAESKEDLQRAIDLDEEFEGWIQMISAESYRGMTRYADVRAY